MCKLSGLLMETFFCHNFSPLHVFESLGNETSILILKDAAPYLHGYQAININ